MVQSAIGKRVTVLDFPDGRLVIRYEGVDLPYRTFDKIRQVKQTAIVENKRLGSLLVPETVQHVLKGLSTNKT